MARRTLLSIAIVACLGAGVVWALFFYLVPQSERSNTFAFTCTASVFQVLLFAASLAYAGWGETRAGAIAPLYSAAISTTAIYNVTAVATLLLFTRVLLPKHTRPEIYYATMITEIVGYAIVIIALHVTCDIQRNAHSDAATQRTTVDLLLRHYTRVRAGATAVGWQAPADLHDRLRFSNALRTDPTAAAEVMSRLKRLEAATEDPAATDARAEFDRLLTEIAAFAK